MIRAVAIPALMLVAACGGPAGPALGVEDVRVFAPLPGTGTAVAYLTIVNGGTTEARLTGIRSPQYATATLHQSEVIDGVSRMRPIDAVTVPAGGRAALTEGGRHVMLTGPRTPLSVGDAVSLELRFDDGSLLVVDARLGDRLAGTG